MLKSTYRRGGEAVLVALGASLAEGKLFCDLLSAGSLPDKVYTLKGEDLSNKPMTVKVNLPEYVRTKEGPQLFAGLELDVVK